MWYASCTEWKEINQKLEPSYLIKYAQSSDGIKWEGFNQECIKYKYDGEAICRPSVLNENGIYKMWYSTRNSNDYRNNKNNGYRIGYAESDDGINWTRIDNDSGINPSHSGWDSQMICYPHITKHGDKKYMFYNGNDFGKYCFGWAVSN